MLAVLIATSYGDPLVIWTAALVLFTFPSAYLAWVTVQDRKERKKRQGERQEEHRLYEMLGAAFWGPDKSKWPKPGDDRKQPVVPLVEAIHKQVQPSNGTTTAATVEQIREMIASQNETVEDLQKGMAKITVLVAEHVSNGHGGQTSW